MPNFAHHGPHHVSLTQALPSTTELKPTPLSIATSFSQPVLISSRCLRLGRPPSPDFEWVVSAHGRSDSADGEHDADTLVEVIREKVQDGLTGEPREMQYTQCKIVGNGSFGVVFQTKLSPNGEDAAIKRVLQDKRFKVFLFR